MKEKVVYPSKIAEISEELNTMYNNLNSSYQNIKTSLSLINSSISILSSYNGSEASTDIINTNTFLELKKSIVTVYKYFWNINVSNQSIVTDVLVSSSFSALDESILSCKLESIDLLQTSSILAGLITSIESTLNINFDGESIVDFTKKLHMSPKWGEIEKNNINILPNEFSTLTHLDLYNQTGPYKDITIDGASKTIEESACGLSILMASIYKLYGKDTNYLDFVKEALSTGLYNGAGSEYSKLDANDYYKTNYGIECHETDKNYDNFVKQIKDGKVVVEVVWEQRPNIQEGGFNVSDGQHFIALVDYDDKNDKIYVYNPNGNNTGWHSREEIERYVISVGCLTRTLSRAN